MPHSSGGGSHGGGSHGGSHSSRGGRGGSSLPRISRTHYPGAHRYRYYRHGTYRYVYSARKGKLFHPARLLLGFFYIPFLAGIVPDLISPFAKRMQSYDTQIIIKDEAHVLEADNSLENALSAFYDKTKITPAVITVNNETWQSNYGTLESYAYNRYLAEFDDEMHWLIVYSEPKEGADPNGYVDWYWEGMQGDDTDDVLTTSVTGRFNQQFQGSLETNNKKIAENLAHSFQLATQLAKEPGIFPPKEQVLPPLFILAFLCLHAYFMLGLNELKYIHAEYDPEDPQGLSSASQRSDGSQPSYTTQQSFGTQQPFGSQQPFGTQQQFTKQLPFDSPNYVSRSESAPEPEMQSLETMPGPNVIPKPTSAEWANPQAFMDLPDPQSQTFLNLPDTQPQTYPSLQAAQPQTYPSLQTAQPQTYPSSQTAQPQSYPSSQAAQPQSFAQPELQVPPEVKMPPEVRLHSQESPRPQTTCPYCGTTFYQGVKYCPGCGISQIDLSKDNPFG